MRVELKLTTFDDFREEERRISHILESRPPLCPMTQGLGSIETLHYS